ncbi:Methyltransferase domain-containing protein [Paenibacillus sp. UNC496MF]|uniref:methyltransferase domain-containing protein n=1 Tax=Paenibacillus sp. UNC496MF TaxID=1502753 RepID=UPI0008F297C1|nr:methyltransferase domain-containing protein [Paenibacillus sp. UNC496MF]SFI50162.1 Methyltransferase domain-containing protein [Paenibacillus sp. UNC496MF]
MEKKDLKTFVLGKLELREGMRVLDLGCGPGGDLLALGKRLRDASYDGVDASAAAIAEAEAAAAGDGRFRFRTMDISAGLPFEDGCFDAVYSINLLECIVDKAALLREIHRVLKPGGQTVMAHLDFDTQLFDGTDKARVRRLVQAYSDWQQAWMDDCDAWMGRRLWKHVNGSGLFDGAVDAFVLTDTRFEPGRYGYDRAMDFGAMAKRGLVAEADYAAFLQEQQALGEAGRFFYSITMFAYDGRKKGG